MLSPLERYCVKVGSDESRLNVSHGQSHKTISVHKSQFYRRKDSRRGIAGTEVLRLITSLPSGSQWIRSSRLISSSLCPLGAQFKTKRGWGGVRFRNEHKSVKVQTWRAAMKNNIGFDKQINKRVTEWP